MSALAIWRIVRPLLPFIGGALAIIALIIWIDHRAYQRGFHKRDPEIVSLNLSIEAMKAASARALADAQENARRIETAQTVVQQETSRDLQANLAAARAAAAAYAARLRNASQAAAGGASQAGGPGAGDAPGSSAGAGAPPELDDSDLMICTENTVKAIGWRAWWLKLQSIPR